ncbi:hypothetical protein MRX96_043035 [Rhipicephalus microplus]
MPFLVTVSPAHHSRTGPRRRRLSPTLVVSSSPFLFKEATNIRRAITFPSCVHNISREQAHTFKPQSGSPKRQLNAEFRTAEPAGRCDCDRLAPHVKRNPDRTDRNDGGRPLVRPREAADRACQPDSRSRSPPFVLSWRRELLYRCLHRRRRRRIVRGCTTRSRCRELPRPLLRRAGGWCRSTSSAQRGDWDRIPPCRGHRFAVAPPTTTTSPTSRVSPASPWLAEKPVGSVIFGVRA